MIVTSLFHHFLILEMPPRSRPKFNKSRAPESEAVKAKKEQRTEFNKILNEVNTFAYSQMIYTRKDRQLKRQWEEAKAEALGCVPEKGVAHGWNHLKTMRGHQERKRKDAEERKAAGEDVNVRQLVNRDITQVRKLRKDKRKEKRQKQDAKGVSGECTGKSVKNIITKYSNNKK